MEMSFATSTIGQEAITELVRYILDDSPNVLGDINGDGEVNLIDAILALQVVCGITPNDAVYKAADVNGDGKIGLEEVM